MSDVPTKLLGERITALIERVKVLAAERDAFRQENEELRLRLETHDREHTQTSDRAQGSGPGIAAGVTDVAGNNAPTPVTIYGKTYHLRGDGDAGYLHELAQEVDRRMREVAETTGTADTLVARDPRRVEHHR